MKTLTFLVFPLKIQRGPVIIGGAGLGGEVPARLGVGSHHVRVRGQSWKQGVNYYKRVQVTLLHFHRDAVYSELTTTRANITEARWLTYWCS